MKLFLVDKLIRPYYLMPIAVFLSIFAANSSALTIRSHAYPESLTVGDRFLYVNTVELQPGMEIDPVTPDEKLGDAAVLSRVFRMEKSPANTVAYGCTLAVYQPGSVRIPTFAFRSSNSADTTTYTGDSLTVNIHSILPPDTTGLQMADIKGPRRLRDPIWPYLAIIAGVVLLIFVGGYLYRRFTGKIAAPVLPPVPPWDIAMQRLDALKGEKHGEFGRFKQFYFELSLIIRGYIEGRYETPAVESTTYELEDDPKIKTGLSGDLYRNLFDFIMRSDLVKFAKSIPTAKDTEKDIAFAYDLILQTKPLPVPETTPEKAAPVDVKD
jgi:hypothetical protein